MSETRRPGPHPLPPADLGERELPLEPSGDVWYRIHKLRHDPLHFGRNGTNRFDAPDRSYGVLYAASDPHGAFVETFGHATGTRIVTISALEERGVARLRFSRALALVDLTGRGLARLGADNRLCDGDYEASQAWSAALYHHPQTPDGISYRSRHDPSRICAALFDRVTEVTHCEPTGALAAPENRLLLADLLDTYRYGLVDDQD